MNMRPFLISFLLLLLGWMLGVYFIHQSNGAFDRALLHGGNLVIAFMTLVAFLLVKKNLGTNPHAFVRGVYGGTLLKMMVLMVALVVYVMMNRAHLHKPSLYLLFGIYATYAVVEAVHLGKMAKRS